MKKKMGERKSKQNRKGEGEVGTRVRKKVTARETAGKRGRER